MRLYKAKCELNVVFFSDYEDGFELQGEALKWAVMNEEQSGGGIVNISELTSLDDLPKGWDGSCTPWGDEVDMTINEWLNKRSKRIEDLKAEIDRKTEELNSLLDPPM